MFHYIGPRYSLIQLFWLVINLIFFVVSQTVRIQQMFSLFQWFKYALPFCHWGSTKVSLVWEFNQVKRTSLFRRIVNYVRKSFTRSQLTASYAYFQSLTVPDCPSEYNLGWRCSKIECFCNNKFLLRFNDRHRPVGLA